VPCGRWRSISAATIRACAAMSYRHAEARAALADGQAADLVVASYMIAETGGAEQSALVESIWAKALDTLLIVEPGTPRGLWQDHCRARATDRIGRPCRSALPA